VGVVFFSVIINAGGAIPMMIGSTPLSDKTFKH